MTFSLNWDLISFQSAAPQPSASSSSAVNFSRFFSLDQPVLEGCTLSFLCKALLDAQKGKINMEHSDAHNWSP